MKLIGIVSVFGGMFVLALQVFDVATPPPYAIWAPIGLGVLLMMLEPHD